MSELNKLLMMFIKDSYKSVNGKPTKKTAIALMKFVASEPELQGLVNNGDHNEILNYKVVATGGLRKAVFENMDALMENEPEYCFGEDSLELLHNMHEETEFLFDLYKDESVAYINEWRKLKLDKQA